MAKNGFSMSNRVVSETLTGTVQATAADCGKHYVVNSTAADVVLNLPSLESAGNGWNITVTTVADFTATKTVKINSEDGSDLYGGVVATRITDASQAHASGTYFKSSGASQITMVSGTITTTSIRNQGRGMMGSNIHLTAHVVDGETNYWAVRGQIGCSGSAGLTTPFS